MTRMKLLVSVSAAVTVAIGVAGGASAATVQLYGGGSTLVAPYLRQAADCYGNPTTLVNQGSVINNSVPPATANETLTTVTPFNYTGSPAFNCATQHVDTTVQLNYDGTGSGAGVNGLFSHDAATNWGDTVPGTDPSAYASVHLAASDAGLSATDVAVYTNGGTEGSLASPYATNAPPGAVVIEPVGTAATPGQVPPQYNNPVPQYGALIQFPLLIAPVAFGYSPVYKEVADSTGAVTSYKFNVYKKNADGSGGLALDIPTLCGIFYGTIVDWGDPAITALNGKKSLVDPTDPVKPDPKTGHFLPIELVGRSDSSGTTSIFYRALAAQCTATPNPYLPGGSKKLPTGLQGNTYTSGTPNNGSGDTTVPQTGKFTLAKGSSGIAQYIAFTLTPPPGTTYTQGRLGYLGPDYVLPAVLTTGANTYGLNVVDVKVGSTLIEPTAKNALLAFGAGTTAILPPQSTSTGVYSASVTAVGLRSAPQDWAEPISTTITYSNGGTGPTPLANPTLINPKAYPFVGTSNGLFYTCYASSSVRTKLIDFLDWYELNGITTDPTNGLIAKAGLAPMPAAWRTAIKATFLKPVTSGSGATNALNLSILQAATGAKTGAGSQCYKVRPGA